MYHGIQSTCADASLVDASRAIHPRNGNYNIGPARKSRGTGQLDTIQKVKDTLVVNAELDPEHGPHLFVLTCDLRVIAKATYDPTTGLAEWEDDPKQSWEA